MNTYPCSICFVLCFKSIDNSNYVREMYCREKEDPGLRRTNEENMNASLTEDDWNV